jgi:uncharacterized membrane protein
MRRAFQLGVAAFSVGRSAAVDVHTVAMRTLPPNDRPMDGHRTVACPNCGHELSMFSEPEPARGERRASAVAEVVASWRFPVLLLLAIALWLAFNIIARPIDPYPMAMVGILAATLATIAACQGPLILLTQRRAAMRDRERDRETYLVAANAEADLHALHARIDELTALARTPLASDD